MKNLLPFLAVLIVLAFALPVFAGGAGTPQTKAECEKAGMHWDDKMKMCHKQ